jgi:hypothetical protein
VLKGSSFIRQDSLVQPGDVRQVLDVRANGHHVFGDSKGAVVLGLSRPAMTDANTHDEIRLQGRHRRLELPTVQPVFDRHAAQILEA